MPLRILICDDSSLARKQMARALPDTLDADISFAENGHMALALLHDDEWDLLFLDLNMPELDGYGVLQAIKEEDLPVLTVVVSGDIQPQAKERVHKLGALAFIKKPTSTEQISTLLSDYGIYRPAPNEQPANSTPPPRDLNAEPPTDLDLSGYLQEIANVAMGRASDLLARLLGTFIKLPVPKVDRLARSELYMALSAAKDRDRYSAVCQGFTGTNIAGESLLLFSDSQIDDMATLLGYANQSQPASLEVLMDLSSILFGAFIQSFGEQLNVHLGLGHPVLLGQHQRLSDLLEHHREIQEELVCIEIRYEIEGHNIFCDLLIVLTESSISSLEQQLKYLVD